MTENEKINGWTFEETIKTAESLMEAEKNMFKWDVLRHLRDFVENYKDKVQQYEAIGTVEEFKALKEKSVAKKPIPNKPLKRGEYIGWHCPMCNEERWSGFFYPPLQFNERCPKCGQVIDWNFREYET